MQIKPDKQRYSLKKVTKETIDAILKDIKDWSPNKYAAESNCISETHFYQMIKQGICDIEQGVYDSLYAYLAVSLSKIQQEKIKSCQKDIRKNKKGHKGAEWILEHSFWRTFCADAKLKELAEEIEFYKGIYKGNKNHGRDNSNE